MHWITIWAKNRDRQDALNNTGSNVRPELKSPNTVSKGIRNENFLPGRTPYLQQITPAKIKLSYCPSECHKIKSHRLIKNGSCESEFTAEGRASLSVHSSVMSRCTAAQEDPGVGRGQTNWQMERTNSPRRSWLLSPLNHRSEPPTLITWPPLHSGSEDIREPQWRVGLKMRGNTSLFCKSTLLKEANQGHEERDVSPFLNLYGSRGVQAAKHTWGESCEGTLCGSADMAWIWHWKIGSVCVCVYDWLILQ